MQLDNFEHSYTKTHNYIRYKKGHTGKPCRSLRLEAARQIWGPVT